MPQPELEAELHDLVERILTAGRRQGEQAATHRLVAAVRSAAADTSTERRPTAEEARIPEPVSSPTPAADAAALPPRAAPDRLPPYWRPR